MASDFIKTKSSAALTGLAIGETFSWTTQFSRSQRMPAWLSRIRNEIDKENYSLNITSQPVPFALNQSTAPMLPAPADITEWAAWTATLLIKNDGRLTETILHSAWQELANQRSGIPGRISVQAALRNIEKGLRSPECGRFNPHYFDDAALPRAVVIGAVHAGNTSRSVEIAELDASFTQFEDGVYCARALACAVSSACRGASISEILSNAIDELPTGSLSRRTVLKALDGTSADDNGLLQIAHFLLSEVCNLEYSYGNVAHEILACALVIIRYTGGDFERTIGLTALVPKPGAGLLSVCSSLARIISGYDGPENSGRYSVPGRLSGNFVPLTKDIDLMELADKLGALSDKLIAQSGKEDN